MYILIKSQKTHNFLSQWLFTNSLYFKDQIFMSKSSKTEANYSRFRQYICEHEEKCLFMTKVQAFIQVL